MHNSSNKEGHTEPRREQIIEALSLVLESDKFTAAPQMSAFLKYVVEQAASGNMTRIKAYTVAIDALGKPDTFDPQNDPVVRVLAGRLRAALASYYDSHPNTPVQIMMRPGTYVPTFKMRAVAKPSDTPDNSDLQRDEPNFTIQKPTKLPSFAEKPGPIQESKRSHFEQTFETDDSFTPKDLETASQQAAIGPSFNTAGTENSSFFAWLNRLPLAGIALAILGVAVGILFTHYRYTTNEEPLMAALHTSSDSSSQIRYKPEKVSLFISQTSQSNSLKDQVNTMMSSVFSESEALSVFRIMESVKVREHWPEDYLVSVDILPLPSETRVNVQLVEAQTGRISHSQNLALSKSAQDGISDEELNTITMFAKELISEEGPLFEDYRQKESNVVSVTN